MKIVGGSFASVKKFCLRFGSFRELVLAANSLFTFWLSALAGVASRLSRLVSTLYSRALPLFGAFNFEVLGKLRKSLRLPNKVPK